LAKVRKVEIRGVDELSKNLKGIVDRFSPAAQDAVYQIALEIQDLSMDRTPVDRGFLRGSHTTSVNRSRDMVQAIIGVGGPAAPYAIPVHERMDVRHKNGRAKFLQSAMEDSADDIGPRIRDRIRRNRGLE
jgi:hypothetical protein